MRCSWCPTFYKCVYKIRYIKCSFNLPDYNTSIQTNLINPDLCYTAIEANQFTCPNGSVDTTIYTATEDGILFLICSQSYTKNYAVKLCNANNNCSLVGYCYDDYNGNTRRNTFVVPMTKGQNVKIWNAGGSAISFPNGCTFCPYDIKSLPYNYFIKF